MLCKQLEERLPEARFSHSYVRDFTGDMLLQIQGKSDDRYYAQTLRNSQEPGDVAERFYDRLSSRNPKPTIWLPRV